MFAQEDPPKDNSGWKWAIAIAVVTAVATEGARLVADIVRDRVLSKPEKETEKK